MKNHEKFWIGVFIIGFALSNIFSSNFREMELFILSVLIVTYIIINIFYFLWKLANYDEDPVIPDEFFILYWLLIIPLQKLNKFIDNF